jgi:hypothetical protein
MMTLNEYDLKLGRAVESALVSSCAEPLGWQVQVRLGLIVSDLAPWKSYTTAEYRMAFEANLLGRGIGVC